MKILLTSDWYEPNLNGVVVSILALKEGLEKEGHQVKILTLSPTNHSYVKENIYYKSSLPLGVYPNVRLSIPKKPSFYRDLVNWKPDIVHSNCEFFTFILAAQIAQETDAALVHTYHTLYEYYVKYVVKEHEWIGKGLNPFLRTRLKYVDYIIAPTEKTRKNLAQKGFDKNVSVIPTGIDIKKYQKNLDIEDKKRLLSSWGIPEGAFVVGAVGRLAQEKNVQEILSFFPSLIEEYPDIYGLFVGSGPYEEALEEEARRLGIENRVIFPGSVPQERVADAYKCLDIFLCASESESQGLTYIEALASSRICLCKRDDCLVGVIEDGENGFLYDGKDEFLEKFKRARQEVLLGDMKKRVEESSEAFSKEIFCKRVIDLYKEVEREGHKCPYKMPDRDYYYKLKKNMNKVVFSIKIKKARIKRS